MSDGITSKANEYKEWEKGDNISVDVDIVNQNSLGYAYWEKKWLPIFQNSVLRKPGELPTKVHKINLNYQHSTSKLTFWETYKNLSRNTNLKYNDLLGSYHLFSCPETSFLGKTTHYPIYRKVLSDGTEAFLYKNKYGTEWQVNITYKYDSSFTVYNFISQSLTCLII